MFGALHRMPMIGHTWLMTVFGLASAIEQVTSLKSSDHNSKDFLLPLVLAHKEDENLSFLSVLLSKAEYKNLHWSWAGNTIMAA